MVDCDEVSVYGFWIVSGWGWGRFGDVGSKLDSSIRKFLLLCF